MSTMDLSVKEGVHVLTLTNHDNENTFTLDVMHEYISAFNVLDSYQGDTALLITCEHEKTFSTGINLEWLLAEDEIGKQEFSRLFNLVMYRLAMLSAPSVVCINGNAYAGAAILAAAADFRVMRADRGRFCLPEINIKMVFPPMIVDIINLLPNKHALKTMALTGRAYTGLECKEFDIVDSIYPTEELQQQAFTLAQELSQKDRTVYTTIRNSLRPDVARHGSALGL
ncbi:MAG: enoyl-CoA hydratase/isomerase family protein [Pseudomonadales bacterium]